MKYQQIQEDVGGVSILLGLKKKKKKKILGVHKREGKGLKFQYILWVDFMGF